MIRVEWSHVQWSISPEGRSFITGFLVTSGGDISKSDSHTDITVNLDHNLTTSTRSRNIIVTNISTGETTKISIVQNAGMAVSMTIDPALIYQKVTGFGGMLNPTIWVGAVNQITLAETEKMYSQTGLGYNIIRMMVYPDKTDWDKDIEVAKKAQSLGAIVFASPWYPPANMTGTRKSAFDATQTKYLLPEYYKDYAAHLKEFVDYMSSKPLCYF